MPDLEFYESPDFWLNKKLEAMDNIEVFGFETSSNATDCEYEYSFISNTKIDTRTLIEDLNSPYFKKHKFDAEKYVINRLRSKNYKIKELKNREAVKDNLGGIQNKAILNKSLRSEDQQSKEIEDLYHQLLSSSLSLNTTECYIDTLTRKNSFDVNIDIYNKKVTYSYTIHFKKADKYPAIQLKTNSVGSFFFFLEKVYGKREANILKRVIYIKFVNALKSASSIDTLVFLYDNLPYYIKRGYSIESEEETKPYKIPDTLLWKHFLLFVARDDEGSDASYYVLSVMSLLTPEFCMTKFLEDQSLVLKVYNGLDDKSAIDTFFGFYELSDTFTGNTTLVPTNQDVFVTLLNAYMQLFEKKDNLCVFEATGVHFHQGTEEGIKERILQENFKEKLYEYKKEYRLNSNITSSNTGENKNKVYIINYIDVKRDFGENFNRNGSVSTKYENISGYTEKGYYNPLDVVKFTQYNDSGEALTMNVPALFVKYASDVKEWERVNKGIRFGFNILQIVVSVSTIYSGASSLMLYAALADFGLAYTDVIIQGVKGKGSFKGKEGEKFLESWEQIYTVGSLATFSPVAVKFVARNSIRMTNYGTYLLQVTKKPFTNSKVYERVFELTTKAIYNLEIPNFNKIGLQILKKGIPIPGLKYASKLQKAGVLFVKGAENTYAAIYKGVAIASGKVKIVAKKLRRALRELRDKELRKYLDSLLRWKIYESYIGTGGLIKYKKVLSRNMIGQEKGMACAAACIEQLAVDLKISNKYSQFDIFDLANAGIESGMRNAQIEEAMIGIFGTNNVKSAGYASYKGVEVFKNIANYVSDIGGTWIAVVREETRHAILVDKIVGNSVYIRDPWPLEGLRGIKAGKPGVEAILDLDYFAGIWEQTGGIMLRVK